MHHFFLYLVSLVHALQVVDGLEGLISCGFSDQMVHIREKVADNVQLVLSSGNNPASMYAICEKLLTEPIRRVISDTSISHCSAWISQNVQVFVTEDRRQQKVGDLRVCIILIGIEHGIPFFFSMLYPCCFYIFDNWWLQLHKIIRNHFESHEAGVPLEGLLVLFRQSQSLSMVKAAIQEEGYSADCFVGDSITKNNTANPVLEQFR